MDEYAVFVANLRPSADPSSITRLFSRLAKLTINVGQVKVSQSADLQSASAVVSLLSERERVFAIRAIQGCPRSRLDGDCLQVQGRKLQVENKQLHELRQRLRDRTKSQYKALAVTELPRSPAKKEPDAPLSIKPPDTGLGAGWKRKLFGRNKEIEKPTERYYLQGSVLSEDGRIQVFKSGEHDYLDLMFGLDVGSYACAFLNSKTGGTLYIGVNEDGSVKGITCNQLQQSQVHNEIKQALSGFIPGVERQMYSVSFIRVRVEDTATGWLNNSALRVVEFTVKGAGTDEDTWYEDNQGQIYIGEGGLTQPVRVSRIKAHLLEEIRRDTKILCERKKVFEGEHAVLVRDQRDLSEAQQEVRTRTMELDSREDMLTKHSQELKQKSEKLQRDMEELRRVRDEVETTKRDAQLELKELEQQQESLSEDIKQKKQQLEDMMELMEKKQADISSQLEDISQQIKSIEEERRELAQGRQEVAQQKATLEEDQRFVDAEKERLKSRTCVIQ